MDIKTHNRDLLEYYRARSAYYDLTYTIEAQQEELACIAAALKELFSGRRVLEVACGTGYWTEILSGASESVLATDAVEGVLDVARSREIKRGNVVFRRADAFDLEGVEREFTAGFHFRWISHIHTSELSRFLKTFHGKLRPGAPVAFGDDSMQAKTKFDDEGNFYSIRKVKDGSRFAILKNRPREDDLTKLLGEVATDIRYRCFDHFWLVDYRLRA